MRIDALPASAQRIHEQFAFAFREATRALPRRRGPPPRTSLWRPDTGLRGSPYRVWANLGPAPDRRCTPPVDVMDHFFPPAPTPDTDEAPQEAEPPSEPPPPVTKEEVKTALRAKGGKAQDDDAIAPQGLRSLPDYALTVLAELFTRALRGDIPSEWRRGRVVPIHKEGRDPTLATSWRPVTITSLVSRLWERVVKLRLEQTIEARLSSEQFGYRRARSAPMACATLRGEVMEAISHTTYVGADRVKHTALVACLDATDAFGTVSHAALAKALEGIPYKAAILSWLEDRTVHLRGGQQVPVRRGVPQGSVLGPVLWLLYLNSAIKTLQSTRPTHGRATHRGVISYADDITLWTAGANPDRAAQALNSWATRLRDRLAADGVKLSPKSTVHIVSGAHVRPTCTTAVLGMMPQDSDIKLLGVRWARTLHPQPHWKHTFQQTDQLLDRLAAVGQSLHPANTRTLYVAYILPRFTHTARAVLNLGWNVPKEAREERARKTYNGEPFRSATASYQLPECLLAEVEKRHLRAGRAISGTYQRSKSELVLREAGLWPIALIAQKLACKEDERASRLQGCRSIAAIPQAKEPVLTSLPYDPPFVEAGHVAFFTEGTAKKGSTAGRKHEEMMARIAAAASFLGPRYTVVATDGSHDPEKHRSVGAAVRWPGPYVEPAGPPEATATRSAGMYGCSYSAELRAAEAAFLTDSFLPDEPVLWVTDSLSLVSALRKGPLAQSSWAEANLWKHLLSRRNKVACVWTFSHLEEELHEGDSPYTPTFPNSLADAAAEEAVSTADAVPPKGHWYVDTARARWTPYFNSYVEENEKEGRLVTPLKWEKYRHVPASIARLLCRLRSGSWAPCGLGDTHGDCPFCGEAEAWGGARGIRHLFCCEELKPLMGGEELLLSDLWEDSQPSDIRRQRLVADFALAARQRLLE